MIPEMPVVTEVRSAVRHPARPRLPVFAASLLVLCVLAGACGLSYDSSPRTLSGGLPAALTSPPSTVTTTTLPKCARCAPVDTYYVQNLKLSLFPQEAVRPLTIAKVLRTLEGGPSRGDETATGGPVTTDLAPGSQLQALGLVRGVARVGLDSAFYGLGIAQAILELGQVVYTLTQSLGVSAVQFYFQGAAVPAVNASGQDVTGPVNEGDYCGESEAGCPVAKTTTTTTTTTAK